MWDYSQPAGGQPTCCCQRLQEEDNVGVDESKQGGKQSVWLPQDTSWVQQAAWQIPKLWPFLRPLLTGRAGPAISYQKLLRIGRHFGRTTHRGSDAQLPGICCTACPRPDALVWGSEVTGSEVTARPAKHSCRKQFSVHT